jgi:hypothetical protein
MNFNTLSMPPKEGPTNKSLMENFYHHDLMKTGFTNPNMLKINIIILSFKDIRKLAK